MASVADLAEFQRAALSSLSQRMADFEEHLKASTPGADLTGLQTDFIAFKEHVWSVLNVLQQRIVEVSKSIDVIEMRHRRKFLLLGGVSEKPDEKVADIVSVLKNGLELTELQPSSLTECHRLGTPSDDRPRPILIRFCDPAVRDVIWKSKSKFKGSSFVLSEFLTRQRQTAFSAARKLFGMSSVWTMDGNIHVKLPDGKRRRVYCLEEVVKLGEEHGKTLDKPANSNAKSVSPKPVQMSTSTSPIPAQPSTRSRRILRK